MSSSSIHGYPKLDLKRNIQGESITETIPPPQDDPIDLISDVITSFTQTNPTALLTSLDHFALFLDNYQDFFESISDSPSTFSSLHSVDLFVTLEAIILQPNEIELIPLTQSNTFILSFPNIAQRPSPLFYFTLPLIPHSLSHPNSPPLALSTIFFIASTRLCLFTFGTHSLLTAFEQLFYSENPEP
jgi:hypothetical protein